MAPHSLEGVRSASAVGAAVRIEIGGRDHQRRVWRVSRTSCTRHMDQLNTAREAVAKCEETWVALLDLTSAVLAHLAG